MRATNPRHFQKPENKKAAKTPKASGRGRKAVKATSAGIAVVLVAAAFIVPTTTLAPGVEAYADSRIASNAVGNIDKFSAIIKDNCTEAPTMPAPVTANAASASKAKAQPAKADAAKTAKTAKAAETKKAETSKTEAKAETKPVEEATKSVEKATSPAAKATESYESYDNYDSYGDYSYSTADPVSYSGETLLDIANPDYSYSPSYVSLSSYDRAKLERLVMGEAGTMGFTGCALVAQSIRDSMNRSNTNSIDQIISEYQYFGDTNIEPNADVLAAVSFIFDQNGAAVQHRVLCFYIGSSSWHETQNFIVEIGGVRFFDLTV